MKTQAAPNWQLIAKSYFVNANPVMDSITFARGKNCFTELRHVHAQQVAVQAYYRYLKLLALKAAGTRIAKNLGAQKLDAIRAQAEAQFGQMLLGIK